jgi:hypothetical protein
MIPLVINPMNCERCGKPTTIHIMSMYNTQEICMKCREEEEQRPDYRAAVEADNKKNELKSPTKKMALAGSLEGWSTRQR